MTHLRTLLTTAFAVTALVGTAAFAQDPTVTSDTTATVEPVTTLTINTAGADVGLFPTVLNGRDTDATTTLSYASNDGDIYRIHVGATPWGFTPSISGNTASSFYPVLSFDGATATGGATAVEPTTPTTLIDDINGPVTGVDVATGIQSMEGDVTVTLGASVTQEVVAGAYLTTLTYTITTP